MRSASRRRPTILRRALGGGFKVLGTLVGAGYYLLCLAGFAKNLGGAWFLAALFIPPLDIAYPFVHLWKFDVFPWALTGIGVASVALYWTGSAIAGTLKEDFEERDRIAW